jgi:hypothetical protein
MVFFGAIGQVRAGQFVLNDYKTRPSPPPQPNMPGGANAPVRPALHAFDEHPLALDAIRVPTASEAALAATPGVK